jgi:hypothetical protein
MSEIKQRRSQCCSFCHEPGHKISTCSNINFRFMYHCFRNMSFHFLLTYNNYPLVKFYKYLQNRETIGLWIPTYKQFVMNKRISIPLGVFLNSTIYMSTPNDDINIHSIIKYFLMPDNSFDDYAMIFRQEEILERQHMYRTLHRTPPIVPQKPSLTIIYAIDDDNNKEEPKQTCDVCLEDFSKQNYVSFKCKHNLCKDCCKKIIKEVNTCKCHLCRKPIYELVVYSKEIEDELLTV